MNACLLESETLVITFAPRATEADAIWGRVPLQKLGHSVLCFVDVADTWFPMGDMNELRALIAPKLAGYKRIVTYGHSMGGYGALKYGRMLMAQRSVGLGPAWSVAPQDVGGFDQRRPRLYYRPNLHDDMAIRPEDLASDAVVVFDPRHREDSLHASAIERAGCRVHKVYNYFVGHDLLSPCVDGGDARGFLNAVVSGQGMAALRISIRNSRRRSPRYVARSLDAMHSANRFAPLRQNLAVRHAFPLAESSAEVRALLSRRGYPVPDTGRAQDWHAVFSTGSPEDAVKAVAHQPFSAIQSPTDLRRFLAVHSQTGSFATLNAFCSFLCAQTGIGGNHFIAYADVVLKHGTTRQHYAAADMLLAHAETLKHSPEKLQLRRIGADLMLRGRADVPAALFSSSAFADWAAFAGFDAPATRGEFMRSRAIDFGRGWFRVTMKIQDGRGKQTPFTCDVVGKSGHSLRPVWLSMFDGMRSIWRGRAGRDHQADPSVTIRIPARRLREQRVNIILKSDGKLAGRHFGFQGATVVRI